jgi:hypothetical protein
MDWDIESNFRPLQDSLWKFVSHQSTKNVFCLGPAELEVIRQAVREIDDASIQERRPGLQRMRHADSIHFVQDVVRKVVALIEV